MRLTATTETNVLEALERLFPESSRTTLRKTLEEKRVRVNGEVQIAAKRTIVPGDLVEVTSRAMATMLDPRIALLHEDDDVIVIAKQPGLLTVASPGEKDETVQAFLNDYLKARRFKGRIHVVHRLDRGASGVLVFAKSFEARETLKERFAAHDIERVYVAIIVGSLSQPEGTFRSFLMEDKSLKVRSVRDPLKGKLAVTHYKTLAAGTRYSMLEVRLETGRRNQIRVHLAESGHPIIGDLTYGDPETMIDPIGRLALHARVLGFAHPTTGETLRFECPVPDSFTRLGLGRKSEG